MSTQETIRIFIVDDDPVCRELYQRYLINIGFTDISLFDNGQDCINALVRKPDIILLDHQMEPVDGLSTLKKIKRFDPDIYLVYVSGQSDLQTAVDALKYGAFDYVVKGNNDEKAIASIVRKIIEVRELLSRKDIGNRWNKLFSLFSF